MLRAVLVTPLSGSLARFGQDGARALDLWARHPHADRVELGVYDSHPDLGAALRDGLAGNPDIVFGPYGSGPARRVATAADRLIWNHGGASTQLTWGKAPNVINVLAPADTYLHGVLEAVREADPSLSTAVTVHADTGFGRDVAGGAARRGRELGFAITPRAFPPGEVTDQVPAVPSADVLCVAAGFADEVAVARALLDRPWRAAAFVGAGERSVLAELGERREGLLGPAQWLATAAPQPDLGPPAGEFIDAFRTAAGRDPSYPAVQAFAAGVLAGHCVETAGAADDEAVRDAAVALNTRTLLGRFALDPVTGRQVGQRVLTVQWQGGRRRVVWPPQRATAPLVLPPGP